MAVQGVDRVESGVKSQLEHRPLVMPAETSHIGKSVAADKFSARATNRQMLANLNGGGSTALRRTPPSTIEFRRVKTPSGKQTVSGLAVRTQINGISYEIEGYNVFHAFRYRRVGTMRWTNVTKGRRDPLQAEIKKAWYNTVRGETRFESKLYADIWYSSRSGRGVARRHIGRNGNASRAFYRYGSYQGPVFKRGNDYVLFHRSGNSPFPKYHMIVGTGINEQTGQLTGVRLVTPLRIRGITSMQHWLSLSSHVASWPKARVPSPTGYAGSH